MNKNTNKEILSETVEVLLSYYNGGDFFYDQLDSILNQSYAGKIVVHIRDDGSQKVCADERLKKIECCRNREIIVEKGENVGACRSFLKLIQSSGKADFYFFADQDDVWKLDKIEKATVCMKNKKEKFVLWCSNYTITDRNLNTIVESGVKLEKRTFHFLRAVFFNTFPGCVMGMNWNLMNLLKKLNLSNCMMHDSVTFAIAIAAGKVLYDKDPLIYHRIHENNVIGYGNRKIHFVKWIKDKMKLLIHKEDYDVSELGRRLLTMKDIQFKDDVYDDIVLLSEYKMSLKRTLKLRFHPDIKDGLNRCSLSIHLKILLHLF